MKDAKIHELEAKLVQEEKAIKRLQEDFKRKWVTHAHSMRLFQSES